MESGIEMIELFTRVTDPDSRVDIRDLIVHFSQGEVPYDGNPPYDVKLKFIELTQRQAMVYANIIEQVKAGRTPSDIRQQFEELELVPPGTLPNPHGLLEFAFRKLDKFRQVMVEFVKTYGAAFIDELSIELGFSVGLGVTLGFPPSFSLNVERTATLTGGGN